MGMNAPQTLLAALAVTAAVLASAWLALFVYTRRRQARYARAADRNSRLLSAAEAVLSQGEEAARAYDPDSPEPYGALAVELRYRLSRARQDCAALADEAERLAQAAPVAPPGPVQRALATAWPLPRDWRRQARLAEELGSRIQGFEARLATVSQTLEQLRRAPLDVARRARGMASAIERIQAAGQALRENGLRGEHLDATLAETRERAAVLNALPAYLVRAPDDLVARQATHADVSQAYASLKPIEKQVFDALRRLQTWQAQHAEARNMAGVMQLEINTAEQILHDTPAQLDVFDHTAELAQLKTVAQVIDRQARAPDVDALPELSQAATQQALKARDLATRLMMLHKTLQSIDQAAGANNQLLLRVKATMDSLAQAGVCPVAWERSAAERDRLIELHARLASTVAPRNGAQLKADLDKALGAGLDAQALLERVDQVRAAHDQARGLMASPQIATRAEWLQETATVHIAAARYAADNWPPADAVAALRADALALAQRQQLLAPLFDAQPLPEDRVQAWIEPLAAYVRDRQVFEARLARVEDALNAIETQERNAGNLLAETTRALDQLTVDTGSLPPDSPIVLRWNALVELWQRGGRLGEALAHRETGRMADKAAAIEAWRRQIAETVSQLLALIDAEAVHARNQLRADLDAVLAVAPFDLEPAMRAAQQHLQPQAAGGAVPAGRNAPPLEELVEAANRSWQTLGEVREAQADVDSQIAARLDARPDRLDQERRHAWDRLGELNKLRAQLPDTRPIPVALSDADQLDQDYQQAEASLADVARNGRTVKSVLARLDNLIEQYAYIANRGATVTADLENDILRLRDTWGQLSQWLRQLRRYRDQRSRDQATAAALDERLAEVDAGFQDIQRRHKGRPLPVGYAWQELDALLRRARRDVEVERDDRIEVIAAHTIETHT
jgi:hypothetical protein